MFSGNQSDVPNDDCYKIIDETIKEFEKEYPNVKVKYTSGILKEDYSEWLSNQALMVHCRMYLWFFLKISLRLLR